MTALDSNNGGVETDDDGKNMRAVKRNRKHKKSKKAKMADLDDDPYNTTGTDDASGHVVAGDDSVVENDDQTTDEDDPSDDDANANGEHSQLAAFPLPPS